MAIIDPRTNQPYQLLGTLNQFPENGNTQADQALMCRYNSEITTVGGADVYYYQLHIGTTKIDKLYVECRSKIYSQTPVALKAVYEVSSIGLAATSFGLDLAGLDMVTFSLSNSDFLAANKNKPVVPGSLLYTAFRKQWYEINNFYITGFQKFNQVQLQIFATRLQENLTDMFNLQSMPTSNLSDGPIC